VTAHIVVIGGGITGLAAAHALVDRGDGLAVSVLEADDRPGGKIHATPFAGLPAVDCGADMFLARTRSAVDLADELGLAGELVAPARLPAFVWSGGRFHRLPEGVVLGAPAGLWPIARSGLLSWHGKARAALEPLVPRRDTGDVLGLTVRRRFGDEVLERLVGPLVGGINAGDPDRLSLRAVTPQLADASANHRSLLLGLRAQVRAAPSRDPASAFLAPRTGVATLIERLATAIESRGGTIHLGNTVTSLERRPGRRWAVQRAAGDAIEADHVVLATPAPVAAELLSATDADAARTLRSIEYASVLIVTLAVRDDDVARPLAASGYLVTQAEQRTITACSWGSAKWAHWRVPGQTVLRVSAGRDGDEKPLALDDQALAAAVLYDLERHVGLRGDPTEVRVSRWPRSMPQYAPGHVERVDNLVSQLARAAPGIHLAGAAYKGLGVPACIAQGQAAARTVLATFGRR
jgi:protoporphyrinogen/coproporphyrinogen III oxidase